GRGRRGRDPGQRQHLRRLHGHEADAGHVREEGTARESRRGGQGLTMTPQTITLMILIPVAVAGVLVLGIFGGRLSAQTRTRVELAFLGLFYPVMIAFWAWRAIDAAQTQDWVMMALA